MGRTERRQLPRVALLLVVLVAAGCSSSKGSASPTSGPSTTASDLNTTVTNGGTLAFAINSDVRSFNVNTKGGSSFADQMVMARVWPQVFLIDPSGKPVLDRTFAESAELVNTAPQTLVYQINPKAVWSDGVPISADDFIYSWKAQRGNGSDVDGKPYDAASTAGYQDIASVTGSADAKTVTVVFRRPFADWESLFDNLVPAHIARRVGWNNGFDDFRPSVVISGGPFLVTSYVPGDQVVLGRNPRYWGTPPHLDQVIFRVLPDTAQAPTALADGTVGAVYPEPEPALAEALKALPAVKVRWGLGLSFEHLDFNQAVPALSDVAVRRAIALATDRPALAKHTVGRLDRFAVTDGNHIFVRTQPGYRHNGDAYGHASPKKAAAVLEGAGYRKGPGGVFQKHGKPLVLTVSTASDNPLEMATEARFRAQMLSAGIKVVPANAPASALLGHDLPGGHYQLAIFASTVSPYPTAMAPLYQSADPATGAGSLNWTGFSDSHVNQLFAEASTQLSPVRADANYEAIDRILWKQMVTLPLYQLPTVLAFSEQFANLTNNPSVFGPAWDAEQWGIVASPSH